MWNTFITCNSPPCHYPSKFIAQTLSPEMLKKNTVFCYPEWWGNFVMLLHVLQNHCLLLIHHSTLGMWRYFCILSVFHIILGKEAIFTISEGKTENNGDIFVFMHLVKGTEYIFDVVCCLFAWDGSQIPHCGVFFTSCTNFFYPFFGSPYGQLLQSNNFSLSCL